MNAQEWPVPSWVVGSVVAVLVAAWWLGPPQSGGPGLADQAQTRTRVAVANVADVRGADSSRMAPRRAGGSASLAYRFRPGQVLDYDLVATTSLTQRVAGMAIPMAATVRGTVRLTVYEEDRDGFGLGVQLLSHRLSARLPDPPQGTPAAPSCDDGLAEEVYVRLSRRGALESLYLPADMIVSARNTLRGLFAPMAFILAEDATTRWSARQVDVLGAFTATYCREAAGISMGKQYLEAWSNGRLVPVAQAGLHVEATWSARMHPAGFLQSLEGRERMEAQDSATSCSGTQQYSLAFVSEFQRAVGVFPPRHSARLVRFQGWNPESTVASGEAPARAFPGRSLDHILQRVCRVSADPVSGDERSLLLLDLRSLCHRDARAVARALEILGQGTCDRHAAQILTMALATSGRPSAEEGLRALAQRGVGDMRERAVEALGFATAPQPETVQTLDELARSRSEGGEVRRLALQSLGLLGASEDAAPALRQLAGLKLLALQPGAGEDATPWLLAMRNATPEKGEGPCLDVYSRGGEGVRAHALQAMSRYSTDAARVALQRAALHDPSVAVRMQAQALLEGAP